MGNILLSMKFVFASLCISIALFQVAHATTKCYFPQGTKGGNDAQGFCTSGYGYGEADYKAYCTVAEAMESTQCDGGASGTASSVGLTCATNATMFTGGTFCTKVQVFIKATFTGITDAEFLANNPATQALVATAVGAVCSNGGNVTCVAGDIKFGVTNVTRRASTTQLIRITTSQTQSAAAFKKLADYFSSAAGLTALQGINAVMKKITLITITSGGTNVNGVETLFAGGASSMIHFSFLASAMSVVAMVYSKLQRATRENEVCLSTHMQSKNHALR